MATKSITESEAERIAENRAREKAQSVGFNPALEQAAIAKQQEDEQRAAQYNSGLVAANDTAGLRDAFDAVKERIKEYTVLTDVGLKNDGTASRINTAKPGEEAVAPVAEYSLPALPSGFAVGLLSQPALKGLAAVIDETGIERQYHAPEPHTIIGESGKPVQVEPVSLEQTLIFKPESLTTEKLNTLAEKVEELIVAKREEISTESRVKSVDRLTERFKVEFPEGTQTETAAAYVATLTERHPDMAAALRDAFAKNGATHAERAEERAGAQATAAASR